MNAVLDVACSLFQVGLFSLMGMAYGLRTLSLGRQRQRRLEGGEGALIGRPVMEAAYWFFSPLVRLLVIIGATPNHVTAAALVPGLGSAIALATGHLGLGAALAMVAGFCDLLDGALARRLGTSSDAGEVFDAAIDRYNEFFFLAGLAIYYRWSWPLELLALGALLGGFMVSYATAKAEALGLTPPKGIMRRAERTVYLTTGAGLVPLVALVLPADLAANPVIRELSLLVPLALVAVLANVSAAWRLYQTAVLARARAQRSDKTGETRTRSAG